MTSEDGDTFIRNLAVFVRTHEKALANSLLHRARPPSAGSLDPASQGTTQSTLDSRLKSGTSVSATLMAALTLGSIGTANNKAVKLTLTPHHLFYVLSRFEELGVDVGSLTTKYQPAIGDPDDSEYVSFLRRPTTTKGRSDRDSLHSVSSVKSVMSNMSGLFFSLGLGTSASHKSEKAQVQLHDDLRYLYSAMTKIPCFRLSMDTKARMIAGFEEFPFETAVPLTIFKNLSVLEITDLDYRQFFGWDRLSEQIRSLTLKRALVRDPALFLVDAVLSDLEYRRESELRTRTSTSLGWQVPRARMRPYDREQYDGSRSPALGSSLERTAHNKEARGSRPPARISRPSYQRRASRSPSRRASHVTRPDGADHFERTRSGSSTSSQLLMAQISPGDANPLNSFRWRFLRHLSIADNGLQRLDLQSLLPLAETLSSLDLSSNLFTEVPAALGPLTALKSLNMSNCLIDSLRSLLQNPLPAIVSLNLRRNKLTGLFGIEKLPALERIDLRYNLLCDPGELARLTSCPTIREIWVEKNPFTKTHTNFRISIFNLFRAHPGFTDDIILDASSPSHSERRQLQERPLEDVRQKDQETFSQDNMTLQKDDLKPSESNLLSSQKGNMAVLLPTDSSKPSRKRLIELAPQPNSTTSVASQSLDLSAT